MIQFIDVAGDVLCDNESLAYIQMARSGMEMDESGNLLIATTASSYATILINGEKVVLRPSSFLRIRGESTWLDRHSETWKSDAKLFIGGIWKHVAGAPRDPGGGTVGGVRG